MTWSWKIWRVSMAPMRVVPRLQDARARALLERDEATLTADERAFLAAAIDQSSRPLPGVRIPRVEIATDAMPRVLLWTTRASAAAVVGFFLLALLAWRFGPFEGAARFAATTMRVVCFAVLGGCVLTFASVAQELRLRRATRMLALASTGSGGNSSRDVTKLSR